MELRTHTDDYDFIFDEEEMPESPSQVSLSTYLRSVLKYLYAMEAYYVSGNIAIVPVDQNMLPVPYIAPDVEVFPVAVTPEEELAMTSWRLSEPNRPAPTVVFEISSESTWRNDLDPKPEQYRRLGVHEYFAYDPQGYWPQAPHLRGWRYTNGQTQEIRPQDGRLWSDELNSWLVMEGPYLRLYDRNNHRRLSIEEVGEEAQRQAETERRAREVERRARQQAERQAREAERRIREQAAAQVEAERRAREEAERITREQTAQAEAERIAKEQATAQAEAALKRQQQLIEKLRQAGIPLDDLE